MRRLAFLVLAAGLASCAPSPRACSASAETFVAFGSQTPTDRVAARIEGPTCGAAIGVIEIRSADGAPLWAWAAPLHPTFGDYFGPAAKPKPADAAAFATRWVQLGLARTDAAPPWPDSAPGPLGDAHTSLDRPTYEDLRARALPMACHLTGVARETCIVYEPAAAAAFALIERDVAEAAPR